MTDNDNRIQLPPTPVDFNGVVGITGQLHDTYPSGGQQPRFDWMRSYLIGLLSMQSSFSPPTQYRIGTPWFDKTKQAIYIWSGSAWVSLADFIPVGVNTDGSVIALNTHLAAIDAALASIHPRLTYGGRCLNDHVTSLPVPATVQDILGSNPNNLRPTVYINGLLIDPRKTNFIPNCPSKIVFTSGVQINKGDVFTVIIEYFDTFVLDDVIAS